MELSFERNANTLMFSGAKRPMRTDKVFYLPVGLAGNSAIRLDPDNSSKTIVINDPARLPVLMVNKVFDVHQISRLHPSLF